LAFRRGGCGKGEAAARDTGAKRHHQAMRMGSANVTLQGSGGMRDRESLERAKLERFLAPR